MSWFRFHSANAFELSESKVPRHQPPPSSPSLARSLNSVQLHPVLAGLGGTLFGPCQRPLSFLNMYPDYCQTAYQRRSGNCTIPERAMV